MKKFIYLIVLVLSIFIFSNNIYAYSEYKIGDEVKYNDIDFYVIKDSDSEEDIVTLLKKEPLTIDDINLYGTGHINRFQDAPWGDNSNMPFDKNGYGGVNFYNRDTCGWVNKNYHDAGCNSKYEDSDIKYIVDAWAIDNIKENALKRARLITIDELVDNGWYTKDNEEYYVENLDITPKWVNSGYDYWTMNSYDDIKVFLVGFNYGDSRYEIYTNNCNYYGTIRPIVEIYKCTLDDTCEEGIIYDNKNINNDVINKKESNDNVKVPNTLKSVPGLILLIGLVLVCVGINIFMLVKSKDRKKE